MSLLQNSVVVIVVFTVVKAMNITLSDLEATENKTNLLPFELDTDLNITSENNNEYLRTKIKRHEILAVGQAMKMPGKKMLGLYIQFWIDLLSPSTETAGYAPQFLELCKKLFLGLKSY